MAQLTESPQRAWTAPVTLDQQRAVRSQSTLMLQRLLANRLATVGAIIVGLVVTMAVAGPLVAPHDPIAMDLSQRFLPPGSGHPFGTDDFGRDILSRMLYGARQSLLMGIVSIVLAVVAGSVIGLISGYFGGWLDMVIQRIIEVMLAFPDLLLALGIVAILGPSLTNVMIAVGIGSIPVYARLVRGLVLVQREREFVDAAKVCGARSGRIIFRHILPNALSPLIVLASLGIAGAILAGSALSFIGMGAQPPSPEWGAMLSSGRSYLRHEWWIATFPGLILAITALGFNLLGDGLRDATDPMA